MKQLLLIACLFAIVNVSFAQSKSFCIQASCKQTITLPQDSVSIFGQVTASNVGGAIDITKLTTWSLISGPTAPTIVTPSANTTVVRKLTAGTYIFNFNGTTASGSSGSVPDTVLVLAAPKNLIHLITTDSAFYQDGSIKVTKTSY